MSIYDDRPYEVGKGKPPKVSQFKKGQSGNPKGRKRKATIVDMSARELVAEAVNEMIPVTIRNRAVFLPKKYAIIIGIVNDGLTGTPSQRLKAFEALNRFDAFDLQSNDRAQTPEEREAVAKDLVSQLALEAERHFAQNGEYWDKATGEVRKI